MPKLLPYLAVLAAMISIQTGAALAKGLFRELPPEGITFLRLLFATLLLLAWHRPRFPRGRELALILAYGAALGAMNLSFYLALRRVPLAVAVALEFSGPLAVALCGSRRGIDFLWVVSAAAGIFLLMPVLEPGLDPVGVAFGLGAGFFWALYILLGSRAGRGLPTGVVTSVGMIAGTMVAAPFGLKMALHVRPGLLPLALAVAVLSSALPYPLEMVALRKIPSRQFGLLMSVEPVLAALSGLIFLGERLAPLQIAAIGLIITAVIGSARKPKGEAPIP